jgi:hypothetical protein
MESLSYILNMSSLGINSTFYAYETNLKCVIVVDSDIRSDNKPVQNPAVLTRPTFDDHIVLVNGDTGMPLALDRCGKIIWELIDGRRTEAEIIAEVCKNFSNVPDTVSNDVTTLISTLAEEGFIGYEIHSDFLKR